MATFTQVELRQAINGATADMLIFISQHNLPIEVEDLPELDVVVKSAKHADYSRYMQTAKKVRLALRTYLESGL